MIFKPKNRYSAFLYHIGISGILFFFISIVIVFVWYPGFLFSTDGGWQGLRLVAGVDFVLGPILTLMVYKPGKPKLAFDLAIIGLTQIICLFFGCYIVYSDRPIAIIFAEDTIQTLSNESFRIHEINPKTIPMIRHDQIAKIGVNLPADPHKLSELKRNLIVEGPLYLRQNLYIPWEENKKQLLSYSIKPDKVMDLIGSNLNTMCNECNYFYLRSRFGEYLIQINSDRLFDSEIILKL